MVSEVTAYQEKLLPQDWFSNGLGAKFTALSGLGPMCLVALVVPYRCVRVW